MGIVILPYVTNSRKFFEGEENKWKEFYPKSLFGIRPLNIIVENM